MILADTSVVIDWLKIPNVPMYALLRSRRAAVCGVTVAEIRGGARTTAEAEEMLNGLRRFVPLRIVDGVWPLVGSLSGGLRRQGTPIPFGDVIIAATALYHAVPLWTRDGHFDYLRRVAPSLAFYDPTATQ